MAGIVWHGYLLLEKPGALTGMEWRAVLEALREALNAYPDAPQPAYRLHARLSLAGDKVLVEAAFDPRDVNIEDLTRLPAYISNVVPRFTPEQVRGAMREHVRLMGGTTETAWKTSADAARAYIAANRAEWEPEDA